MGVTMRIRPVDDGGRTMQIEAAGALLQDEDGWVHFDRSWPSLCVILEAVDVDLEHFGDEHVDAGAIEELAHALAEHSWESLFEESIVEEDDLPADPEYVAEYYAMLQELAVGCAERDAGWEVVVD